MTEFIDFEPIQISLYTKDKAHSITWTNPDIEDYFSVDEDCPNEGEWDNDVFRLTLRNNQNDSMYICFKSEWFENFNWEENLTEDQFNDFLMSVDITLKEDVWAPGGEQFCFTPLGEIISDRFETYTVDYLSPDIGLSRDGPGEYSWST